MKAARYTIFGLALIACTAIAADPSPQNTPRATLGDSVVEPAWKQRLTITVGAANADIVGTSEKAIQAAIDYVSRFGGGTVKVLPGTYRLRNAIYLQSKVRLAGSGARTILIKEPSLTTTLAQDSDWFDQEITLTDPTGFAIGDGVCLQTKNPQSNITDIVIRTLVARSGNRFKLDQGLRKNFWRLGDTKVSTIFPILFGKNISDIAIEDMVLDGNREKNVYLNGNYGGCIFLQECNRVRIRGVTARKYNGDGMSWQISHDVVVENNVIESNTDAGFHPGSGSQRAIIRNNRVVGNDIGIYFCWGVRQGQAEKNQIKGNRIGISVGHHDTDNIIRNNEIIGSKLVGLLFREERGKDFAANHNRIENNRLVNNGPGDGAAVDIKGGTESVVLVGNEIIETRRAAKRVAIRLGPETSKIILKENRIQGFAKEVDQLVATSGKRN